MFTYLQRVLRASFSFGLTAIFSEAYPGILFNLNSCLVGKYHVFKRVLVEQSIGSEYKSFHLILFADKLAITSSFAFPSKYISFDPTNSGCGHFDMAFLPQFFSQLCRCKLVVFFHSVVNEFDMIIA